MANIPTSVGDERLLRIIFPGGRVDLYDRPVTAREIMNQHPKFCIAKTDFFRVPWFVVSPEAILSPGRQFLLVPKRTIKRLVKQHTKPLNNSTTPHKASERLSAIQTVHVPVSHKGGRSRCARLCCFPSSSSDSLSGFELSPEFFVRNASSFHFNGGENVHPQSFKAERTNRKVDFRLPTEKDIKYYTPSPNSPPTRFI